MSSPRRSLIKAVRVIPEVVRIGRTQRDRGPSPAQEDGPSSPAAPEVSREEALSARVSELESELERALSKASALEAELVSLKLRQEEEMRAFMEEATWKVEELKRQAMEEGRREGFEAGHSQGLLAARAELEEEYRSRFKGALDVLEGIHRSLEEERQALASLLVPQMVRLWEALLSRMLFDRVRLEEGAATRVLKGILAKISDRERLVVYVNPQDHRMVEEAASGLGDLLRGVKHLEVVPDGDVDRGSCIVETNLGVYDARWRTQLEQVDLQVGALLFGGGDLEGE